MQRTTRAIYPLHPNAWLNAFRNLRGAPYRLIGFVFPPARPFRGTQTRKKLQTFLCSWLRYRNVFIFRAVTAESHFWLGVKDSRVLLTMQDNNTLPREPTRGTNNKPVSRRFRMRQLLEKMVQASGLEWQEEGKNRNLLIWRGRILQTNGLQDPDCNATLGAIRIERPDRLTSLLLTSK